MAKIQMYVIWSVEHNAWWKPDRWGYTKEVGEAGEYTASESKQIVDSANAHLGPGTVNEVRIPVQCVE